MRYEEMQRIVAERMEEARQLLALSPEEIAAGVNRACAEMVRRTLAERADSEFAIRYRVRVRPLRPLEKYKLVRDRWLIDMEGHDGRNA